MSDSKNDNAWIRLFEKYNILQNISDNQQFLINATQINEFREARLMTKFDHRSQLPQIFSENNLSILPISRGGYTISTFETFSDFDNGNDIPIIRIDFPHYLQSIDYENITSESAALNCAFVSDMIRDFAQDEELKPTVNGRMSSLSFDFGINSRNGLLNISVENSQLEIDGGYEGVNTLSLIEAKNYISNDFLIRQLYYPFKLWSNKISKKVRPVFLTYTNGVFHFREYLFEDPNHYNSLKLINQKKYSIREGAINLEIIQGIATNIATIEEPQVPFPQADSFERVINLCELLIQEQELSKERITENYAFDARQTDYYTNAGKYLGLIDKRTDPENGIIYFLTPRAIEIFNLSIYNRQLEFIKLILSHVVFKRTIDFYFSTASNPSRNQIIEIMRSSNLYNVNSEDTFARRASTVSSWINWILSLIEEE